MKYKSHITIQDNSNKVLEEAKLKKIQMLVAIGEKAIAIWAKLITKEKLVDTGRYKGSVSYKEGDDHVVIGSNVEYAPYLELGTSKMRARPTLKPTVLNYRNTYKKLAEQIWKS